MRYIKLFIFILPLVMLFFCIYYFGVNIPYHDDWFFLNHLLLYKEGKETISDICLSSQWEHMTGTGFVLNLWVAIAAGCNYKTMLLQNACILIAGFLIVLRYSKKEFNLSFKNIPLWFIPIPFLWFSWVQADNILTAYHSILLLSIFLSLLALYLCCSFIKAESTKYTLFLFVSMIISAILASFSMINGLFVWPILIFNIIFFTKNKIYKVALIGVFIPVIIAYFAMRPIYPHTSGSSIIKLLTEYASNPVYSISYFVSLFGLFANYHYYIMSIFVCFIAGIIMLSALAFLTFPCASRSNLYKGNIFLWSIIIYCIISHLGIFYKNCHLFIEKPFLLSSLFLISRYSSFTVLLVVAVYLLFIKIYFRSALHFGKLNYIALTIIFICIMHYVITPVTYIQPITDKKNKSIFSLIDYKNRDEKRFKTIAFIDDLHDDGIHISKTAPLMEKYSLSIFNKDYLMEKYPLEYILNYETDGELKRFQVNEFEYTGKWRFLNIELVDSMPDNINFNLKPDFLVSSKSKITNKCNIKSKSFMILENSFLYSQFMLSGNFKNRKIGLDLNNDGVPDVDCEPRQKSKLTKLFSRLFYVTPETPYYFDVLFDLSEYKGKEISLIACATGESDAEWIIFTQPIILKKLSSIP